MSWSRGRAIALSTADASYGLARFADRVWGLDAIFPPSLPRPRVRVVAGGGGEIAVSRGISIVAGDLEVATLRWRAREPDAVIVVTGKLTVDTLVVSGPANLWVSELAAELVATDLAFAGSLIVTDTLAAPAWVVFGDGEIVIPKAFTGRIIQDDTKLLARRFKRAEPVSGALAAGIVDLDGVVAALDDKRTVIRSVADIGPTLHGRPVATLEALASTRDVRALAELPDGTVFPRLTSLVLPESAANAHAARMVWPALEQLEMSGPHPAPVGSNVADSAAIPHRMFRAMPALRRLHVRAFRAMSPALLDIAQLESLDLDQEIFNPVFYTKPTPGLLVADIEALKARYPTLRLAFGDDVCFELPPVFAEAIAAAKQAAEWMSRGKVAQAIEIVTATLDAVERAPVLYSHVNRYDLRSLAIWGHAKRGDDAAALAHARRGLAELGPPSGWFLSTKGRGSCRQLAKLAGNQVAWHERERDPVAALAAVELALRGATLGADNEVFDTHARILLALERRAEAYDVVASVLRTSPKFAAVGDIARSRGYRAHIRAKEI